MHKKPWLDKPYDEHIRQSAMDVLVHEWRTLQQYGQNGQIVNFIQSCRAYYAVLHDPTIIRFGHNEATLGFASAANMGECYKITELLQNPCHSLYLIANLLDAIVPLQEIVRQKGDILIERELHELWVQYLELKERLIREHSLSDEELAKITDSSESMKARIRTDLPLVPAHNEEELVRLLNALTQSKKWSVNGLKRLPPGNQLVVQTANASGITSVCYNERGLHTFQHSVDFGELTEKIFRLRRELERGTPCPHLAPLISWFRQQLFTPWIESTETIYYVGTGIFTRLPISAILRQPTVWLYHQPHFTPPTFSQMIKGTALWSTVAPQPLTWTKTECDRLPNFRVKPATKVEVSKALAWHEPVHLALHVNVSIELHTAITLSLMDGSHTLEQIIASTIEVPLLFLSACETSVGNLLHDGSDSLVRRLIHRGAGAVVATKWRIPDDQALVFATAFWGWIRTGLGPIEALHEARRELATSHAHAFELHL